MATAANPFDTKTGISGGSMTNATDTTAAQYTAQERQVQAGTETAAGQLNTILAKDSPLMQRARTQALQDMNKRGLINSSMSAGAGVAAMIDRATPIAQQDAETYSNRATTNMNAVNTAGVFNAGEQNKYGLQLGEQKFTAAENLTGRTFQTSERVAGQNFTAGQNLATQNFQAAQSQLDRAQQTALADKSVEAQQALLKAQQTFQSAQNELDRENQKALQESQQVFTAGQNQLDRVQQVNLQAASQTFQASEAEKTRATEIMLADKSITAQKALETARQEFQAAQNTLDRTQQTSLATAAQNFQASEAEKTRATEIMLADKSITANKALETARQEFQAVQNTLDRTQQANLQTAQQTFSSAQSALDRANQTALTDKSIKAQQDLAKAQQDFTSAQNELDRAQQKDVVNANAQAQKDLATAQQTFTSLESKLDREQQTAITKLQNDINQSNVSKTFAANLALSASTAINAIAADPNLSSVVDAQGTSPKQRAIQNAVDNANATMQWGSTFYNTTLPTIALPGGTAGKVTPGAGAGAGTSAGTNRAATAADISAMYQDLLGRAPENDQVIQQRLDAGMTMEQIRQEIASSAEAVARARTGP